MADYARAMCLVASGFASVCLGLLWFLGIEHLPKGDWPVQSFFGVSGFECVWSVRAQRCSAGAKPDFVIARLRAFD